MPATFSSCQTQGFQICECQMLRVLIKLCVYVCARERVCVRERERERERECVCETEKEKERERARERESTCQGFFHTPSNSFCFSLLLSASGVFFSYASQIDP